MRTNSSFETRNDTNQDSRSGQASSSGWAIRVLALCVSLGGITGTPAAAQSVRVISVTVSADKQLPQQVKFFCTHDYNLDECKSHVLVLSRELAMHPIEQLGSWSFVLGSSDRWRELIYSLGGNAGSPAFTVLGNRTTVLEQALFSATARRRAELLEMFSAGSDTLLRLAVSHELGHALCHEPDEHRADAYGRELRTGKHPFCLSLR